MAGPLPPPLFFKITFFAASLTYIVFFEALLELFAGKLRTVSPPSIKQIKKIEH